MKGGHVLTHAQWAALEPTLGAAEIQIAEDLFIAPVREDQRDGSMLYTNHSCDPNLAIQGQIVLVAMRDIAAGEELTIDWATTDDGDHRMACHCGSPRCRGTVTGKDWMKPELQARYRGWFCWFLQRKIDRAAPPRLGEAAIELVPRCCPSGSSRGPRIYVSLVEHPARLRVRAGRRDRRVPAELPPGGGDAGVARRVVGGLTGVADWARGHGSLPSRRRPACSAAVIAFTLIVILPTNKRLLDPTLDPGSAEAAALLARWGRLHAVRTLTGGVAFLLLGLHLVGAR